jgi:hypothetical protein
MTLSGVVVPLSLLVDDEDFEFTLGNKAVSSRRRIRDDSFIAPERIERPASSWLRVRL